MVRLILVIFMLVALSSQATANKQRFSDKDGEIIEFSSFMGSDLWGAKGKQITAHGILYMPQNASSSNPVPLAILISGLGGQRGRDNRMCDMLSKNGIACFGVRTYASRGIKHRLKTSQKFKIAGAGSRLHDAYGALEKLGDMPAIDNANVWHIGFSLGGFNSALALDPTLSKQFQVSDRDFTGFINLYGFCVLTSSKKLKDTRYYAFIGDGDGNYNKEECDAFISSLISRGVDANIQVFKGSQFKKIGHMWDSMSSATGDWFGKPEGPWKLSHNGNNWPLRGLTLYGCGFEINPTSKEISTNTATAAELNDNDAWELVTENCGTTESVKTNNHKIMKIVDKEIVSIITKKTKIK